MIRLEPDVFIVSFSAPVRTLSIAVVSLNAAGKTYCGKHTKLGELVGVAAYTSVKKD